MAFSLPQYTVIEPIFEVVSLILWWSESFKECRPFFPGLVQNLLTRWHPYSSFSPTKNRLGAGVVCIETTHNLMSSYSLLGLREDGSDELLRAVWAEDPVHLSSAGYAIMAESLVDLLVEETNTFCNVPKTRDQPVGDQRRSAWISNENVGEAGPSRKRGRWSGGPKGWGGGRGWGGRGGGGDRRRW